MKKIALFLAVTAVSLSWGADLPTADVFDDEPKKPSVKTDTEDEDYIPDWVSELSNLSPEDRQRYVNHFSAAKWAYSKGSFDMCERCLDICESIYDKNPNVWNLRASALLSQQCFEAAEVWLKKVRAVYPDDAVSNLNYSLYYLGTAQFEQCLDEVNILLDEIEYKQEMEALSHALIFRKLLCLVMLNRVDEARELVKDVSALTFTPLYYYSQTVFALIEQDNAKAIQEMKAADKIYSSDAYLPTYKQALIFSKVMEKFTQSASNAD